MGLQSSDRTWEGTTLPRRSRSKLKYARAFTRIGSALKGPRKLTDDERRQFDNYRPDIFIQHDMINFHIVEFKCCRDTDPDQQRD